MSGLPSQARAPGVRPPQTAHSAAAAWHVYRWPGLAWVETAIKVVAMLVGTVALARALSHPDFGVPVGGRLVQAAVLGALSLGLAAAIADRLKERELVSMVFVVFNNIGHWGLVLALMSRSDAVGLLVPFCALMLAGDVVKLVFVQVHQFGVRQYSPRAIQGLTGVYVAGYAIVLLLAAVSL